MKKQKRGRLQRGKAIKNLVHLEPVQPEYSLKADLKFHAVGFAIIALIALPMVLLDTVFTPFGTRAPAAVAPETWDYGVLDVLWTWLQVSGGVFVIFFVWSLLRDTAKVVSRTVNGPHP